MSELENISNAIVTELNAGNFDPTFESQQHYLPSFELKDLKELTVSVVPKGVSISKLTRTTSSYDHQIDVGVQKKLGNPEDDQIGELLRLVEQIGDFFRYRRLNEHPEAVWTKTENVPIYDLEHLQQYRQFTSVLTFTFRVVR